MRTPVDIARGRIVDIDERRRKVIIEADYDNWSALIKREYQECYVQMIDARPLSEKQRNSCYALIREIASHTGNSIEATKNALKDKFADEELTDGIVTEFSLSDAPMSLAYAFQRFLVRFMLEFDVPCSFALLEFVDDVGDYLYACIATKKCCICGQPADLHHVERVGMGRDREDMIHEGMEALPLCRGHHTIAHVMGEARFKDQYHIPHGIILDKYLCKIHGLKTNKEAEAEC